MVGGLICGPGGFLKLEKLENGYLLDLGDGHTVSLREEWVRELRSLSFDQFGEYIHTTIYPAFSDDERKAWNKSTINNKELQILITAP
jgi:hypothetical protein